MLLIREETPTLITSAYYGLCVDNVPRGFYHNTIVSSIATVTRINRSNSVPWRLLQTNRVRQH